MLPIYRFSGYFQNRRSLKRNKSSRKKSDASSANIEDDEGSSCNTAASVNRWVKM